MVLGIFDGVHLGHQELFIEALKLKEETGQQIMCLTFEPHPRVFLGLDENNGFKLLSPNEEKKALMAEIGCDYYWAVPFDRSLSQMSPEEFSKQFLKEFLDVSHVVCGFNFTFGRGGTGKPSDLLEFGKKMGFSVSVIPAVQIGDQLVSSTRVRQALKKGDMEEVLLCLGRPYCVYGKVIHGDGRGKSIGLPTSNVKYDPEKALPSNGVYWGVARWSEFNDENQGTITIVEDICAVNVGRKPTFGGSNIEVEVHLPGASSLDLYERIMQVSFLGKIREERRFGSAQELLNQVEKDIQVIGDRVKEGLEMRRKVQDSSPFALEHAYDRIIQDLPWDSDQGSSGLFLGTRHMT